MIIAVDFDGTIVEHKYPEIGRELPFAIETLKKLQQERHRLILWSVREGKLLQEAVDFCRERGLEFYAVNSNYAEETKDAYLDKFHQIDPYTEAVYDTDALAQHIIDCAEVINRLLTYPKDARRAVLYDNLHDSLATFEESAPDYPDPDDDADETDRGEAVDPTTGEIK